ALRQSFDYSERNMEEVADLFVASYGGDREALLMSARYPRMEFTFTDDERRLGQRQMEMLGEGGRLPRSAPIESMVAGWRGAAAALSRRDQFSHVVEQPRRCARQVVDRAVNVLRADRIDADVERRSLRQIFRIAMRRGKARPQRAGAVLRNVGRRYEWPRHGEQRRFSERDQGTRYVI